MDDVLKADLLQRKFQSQEFMAEMADYLSAAIKALEKAIREFYSAPPENWKSWHPSDWPETWDKRVVANLKSTHASIKQGLGNASQGKISTIRSASGSLHNIFGNLSNMGWKWWDYTDPDLKKQFHDNLVAARNRASLIWYTTANCWSPGEILDEDITGPVSEKDLLRYLRSDEAP